ncbi:unnamed protein product [Caenorhabditis angaria]|uniref:SUN domain-containing protein n=1 Tax=Caenorhabditis angaria TaxID=860376 RepID=A0A9P1IQK4_9PELO|nr:unnamed protein product [Caenorhabditis angaria]
MFYIQTFLLLLLIDISTGIGKCDLSAPPTSWLSTNGSGISDWATAGDPTNGTNFCIQGNRTAKTVQVDYHIDLTSHHRYTKKPFIRPNVRGGQNGCVNNNTRIVYCFALCFNETMQYNVIESALKSNQPSFVAQDIQNTVIQDWAIAVIQVDYNDPMAHINASEFLDPAVFCSVYVGIRPKVGFDYLYEIELAKVILP